MPFNFTRFRKRFIVLFWNIIDKTYTAPTTLSAYHSYGKPGSSGENSNGTVQFRMENFRKKSSTFLPFLPKRRKLFVPFAWLTKSRLPLKAEGEKWRSFPRRLWCFANGTTLTRSSFRKNF